jgi:hypothetical protein
MIAVDEPGLRARLNALIEDARLQKAIGNLTADPLLLSLFLVAAAHGEGVAEAGVAAIGEPAIAAVLGAAATEPTKLVVHDLFPEFFDHGQYRYEDVVGRDYYFTLREANRRRLRERGRYSPLNLHLTTTFGHAAMVELVYGAVIAALARSPLSRPLTEHAAEGLGTIVRRDGNGATILARHDALLAVPRDGLAASARDALQVLERLTARDYEWAADLAVREVIAAYAPWEDVEAAHRRILGRA